MSIIMQLARDVAAKVSAIPLPGEERLTAVAEVAPDLDFAQVKSRRTIVSPQSYERNNLTRNDSGTVVKINVAMVEKISISDTESRIEIMELVASALERQKLLIGTTPYALISSVEFDPVYDSQLLRNSRVFISVCVLTVKVINDQRPV